MNYQKVYDDIVLRAKLRQISGVVERHHVIPRCLGGTDDPENIVRLTPEEHYVAHQLLCKLYPLNDDLAYAMLMMANGGSKTVRSNKAYGWVRKRVSKARTGKKRVLSDEARKKMGDASRRRAGIKRGPMSDETKEKIRNSNLGKKRSPEFREKMREIAKLDGRKPPSQLGNTWKRT